MVSNSIIQGIKTATSQGQNQRKKEIKEQRLIAHS